MSIEMDPSAETPKQLSQTDPSLEDTQPIKATRADAVRKQEEAEIRKMDMAGAVLAGGAAAVGVGIEAVKDYFEKGPKELQAEIDKIYETNRETNQKKDALKDLPFSVVKSRLAKLTNDDGTNLTPEQVTDLWRTRVNRFREAQLYGVFDYYDDGLTKALEEATWRDYTVKITDLALKMENDAQKTTGYKDNLRVKGVVADVVDDAILLVRQQGLKNIEPGPEGETDPHNPERRIKFRSNLKDTEEQIRQQVVLVPNLPDLAGLVDRETPAQGQKRLEDEKEAKDRVEQDRFHQRQVELERAKSGGGGQQTNDMQRLIDHLSRLTSRDVIVVEDESKDYRFYSTDYLTAHGLPSYIYITEGAILKKRDMRTVLAFANSLQEFTGLSSENFIRALVEEEKVRAAQKGRNPDFEGVTIKGVESFRKLKEGIIPTILTKKFDGGTFSSLVGSANPRSNASSLDVKGALGLSEFDLKTALEAVADDVQAKEALGVWLAIRGGVVPDISQRGKKFIETKKSWTAGQLAGQSLSIKEAWQILNNLNDTQLTRDEALKIVDLIGKLMQKEMSILPGQEGDVRELSNLLMPGIEMQDWRTKRIKHRVLWDKNERNRFLGRQAEPENAFRTPLEKVVFPQDDDLRDARKKRPEYLSKGLSANGVAGADGLLERVGTLNNGRAIQFQFAQFRDLVDEMDEIERWQKGKDSFSDFRERQKEIDKKVEPMGRGEIPKFSSEDTVAVIKRQPIYNRKGTLATAGQPGFFEIDWAKIFRTFIDKL